VFATHPVVESSALYDDIYVHYFSVCIILLPLCNVLLSRRTWPPLWTYWM